MKSHGVCCAEDQCFWPPVASSRLGQRSACMTFAVHDGGAGWNRTFIILHQLRSAVETTNMCNLVLESTKMLLWMFLLKIWMHACWNWNVNLFSPSQNCIV